jgi:SAM-dependent methyltransferase
MNENRAEKLDRFLTWFSQIHELGSAYRATTPDDAHRASGQRIFERSLPFLEQLQLEDVQTVLDIGSGYGFHCEWFVSRGLEATGIAVHVTPELEAAALRGGYTIRQMDMHFLEFPDASFDLVWSHHALEHSFSAFMALREWYRVLRPGGILAVTVPPQRPIVTSGHFHTGWNVGQLIYILGVSGFELRSGCFFEEGYSVRGLVKRPLEPVDPTGLSWMFRLRKRLPAPVTDALKEVPVSLGKFAFSGELQEVSSDRLVPKKASLVRRLLDRLKGS